jgi:type IV pilus assembly protein PilC
MTMMHFSAVDSQGKVTAGTLPAASQSEALARLQDMGYYPTALSEAQPPKERKPRAAPKKRVQSLNLSIRIPGVAGRVKTRALTGFTRQLATLLGAGLPLLRGLRAMAKQERNLALKDITLKLGTSIEGGSTFSESLAQHPKVFNKLYVNMVKAGELGGALDVVLARLADFMEKAQKIKGKVVSALFYPCAVVFVAICILTLLMAWVVPRFQAIFRDMIPGEKMPAFTVFVLSISNAVAHHFVVAACVLALGIAAFVTAIRTRVGRHLWDHFKLVMPVLGPVVSKVAISRFSRTLGTLISSGVPILQALSIVKETSGNVIVGDAVAAVHESVKEGETITAPLEASDVFPATVISMVDVGEQTGALPEMLIKVADTYDDEVDNAVAAMTSLLEPIMIIFLAGIVGSIVIALFLPLIKMMEIIGTEPGGGADQ